MIVPHPSNGKPIDINLVTNNTPPEKKLVFVRPGWPASKKWSRVDTIVSDVKAATIVGVIPTYVIIRDNQKACIDKWNRLLLSNTKIPIFCTSSMTRYLRTKFPKSSITPIESLHKKYNGSGSGVLTDSSSDEEVVESLGKLLKYASVYTSVDIDVDSVIPSIYLIQQYYKPSQPDREEEINTCLKFNARCSIIDKIILLNETPYITLPVLTTTHASKIECVNLGARMKYINVMDYIRKEIPANVIVIFANSDIFLTDEFKTIYDIDMHGKFMALLRWDVDKTGQATIFGPRADSQDVWGVLSDDVHKLTDEQLAATDFFFGMPGCDNAITAIMTNMGFYCINPAWSLKSYHLHNSGVRGYNVHDTVYNPQYLYLEPTLIISNNTRPQ